MRKILFGMLGLLFWLGTQWLALGIAAAGYGWISPSALSVPLILLYPIAFVRAFCARTGSIGPYRGLPIAIAGVLDVLLLGSIVLEKEYILKGWRLPENRYVLALWIALWAGWQMLLLASLIKDRRLTRT